MKKDTPEITITEEERSRLRELYEEKVLPLNGEFDRQLVDAIIALLKSSAVGVCIIAVLYFVLNYFDLFKFEQGHPVIYGMELPTLMEGFFYAVVIICMWIVGAFIRRLNRRSLLFRENVVPELARMIDPELKYVAEGNVMPSQYYASQLYSKFNEYDGSDLFWGTYRGVPLRFSMVHATRSNGKSKCNIFHGVFFVVDFNKEFHSLTIVKPDKMEGKLGRGISSFFQKIDVSQPGKLIRMEDAEFEKAFVITTKDEVEARY